MSYEYKGKFITHEVNDNDVTDILAKTLAFFFKGSQFPYRNAISSS